MVKFCFECGHKLEYKFNVPNFCPQCGAKIGGGEKAAATASVEKPVKNVSKKSVEIEDGFTNSESIPRISKLEFEIEDFGYNAQQTMGSLAGIQAPKKRIVKRRDISEI